MKFEIKFSIKSRKCRGPLAIFFLQRVLGAKRGAGKILLHRGRAKALGGGSKSRRAVTPLEATTSSRFLYFTYQKSLTLGLLSFIPNTCFLLRSSLWSYTLFVEPPLGNTYDIKIGRIAGYNYIDLE